MTIRSTVLGLGAIACAAVPGSAQTTALADPLMVVFGPRAPSREGDADKIERVFIGVPADVAGPLYLRVLDADTGGAHDSTYGRPDTVTSYRLYGGSGARHPGQPVLPADLTRAVGEPFPAAADAPGTLVAEREIGQEAGFDDAWQTLFQLDPAAGEADGGRAWFRLDVVAVSGAEGNAFSFAVTDRTDATAPAADVEAYAEAATIRWPDSDGLTALRLTAPADGKMIVRNFDAAFGGLSVSSDFEDVPLTASGQGDWAEDALTAADTELRITLERGTEIPNDITVIAVDESGAPIPLAMPPVRVGRLDRPSPVGVAEVLSDCRSVAFDASGSSGAVELRYRWRFGDGEESDRRDIVHRYEEPGRYEAILDILDSENPQRGARQRIPVHVRDAPQADAGAAITVAPGEPVAFSGAASRASDSPITRYRWDFGDGTSATEPEAENAYVATGAYRAVLRVEDDSGHPCDVGVATRDVTVNHSPQAVAGTDQRVSPDQVVHFDARASYDRDGEVVSYRWDTGDGTTLEGPAVSHSYAEPGEYRVRLDVTDESGVANRFGSDALMVTVNAPPRPVATGPDREVAVSEATALSAAGSADPDGEILRYLWDFGDGATAEGPEVEYAWSAPGRFPVTLTLTDDSGTSSAETEATIEVVVNAAPVADAGGEQFLTASVVTFDGGGSTDADGEVTAWEWDFGDGRTGAGRVVDHFYRAPGVYDVTLVVRDDSDAPRNLAQDRTRVTINARPLADAGPDLLVAPGQQFVLDGQGSADLDGAIAEHLWTLPDRTELSSPSIAHAFEAPGLYRVGLEVRDDFAGGAASATDEVLVRVNAAPVAESGPDLLVEPGQAVGFSGGNSFDPDGAIVEWRWDFEDLEEPLTGATVERTFETPGVVTAQLSVTDDSGAVNGTGGDDITVRVNHAPQAEAGADIWTDRLFVDFDASGSSDGDGDALIYAWDFGDGSATVLGRQARHVFAASGSYPVTLTVDDGTGLGNARSVDTMRAEIDARPIAVAGDNREVCSGDAILFDASDSVDPDGSRLRYAWDFGDGTRSDLVNPSKTYELPGAYDVTLTVRDESGSDFGEDIDRIAALVREAPIADAGPDLEACTNQTVRFDGSGSSDADGAVNAFSWNFGDGATGGGERATHVYTEPGTYAVVLTITGDTIGQCSPLDTDEATVVVEPAPDLDIASRGRVATDLPSRFEAILSQTGRGGTERILWDFGDGSTAEGREVTHAFAEPGAYLVTVSTVLSGATAGCDELTAQREVVVNAAPVASFDLPHEVAEGEAVTFDASTSADADGALTAFAWEFGDGATARGAKATHVFAEPGVHTVRLAVTDDAGVENSRTVALRELLVNPAPLAALRAPPPLCAGEPVAWQAGVGPDVAARWTFGDGGEAEGALVTYAFAAPGLYPVAVSLDDGKGLANSRLTEEVYARVNHPPVVMAGPDRTICPGDEVVFDGSASRDPDGAITSWRWEFNDGMVLEGPSVTRSFERPGLFTARLALTDDSGAACSVAEDVVSVLVNSPPLVDAGPDREAFVGAAHDIVWFDAGGATDPDGHGFDVVWRLGDGAEASGGRVWHSYAEPGDYTVEVVARDATGLACGEASDTARITAIGRE